MPADPLQQPATKPLPQASDYLAPDGSEIRLLAEVSRGGLAHCRLPAGHASRAVRHRTVEELWYILSGTGEVWRKTEAQEQITPVAAGVSLSIPTGTHFQFRATGESPLEILIATLPRWPGADEAVPVPDHWEPSTPATPA